MKKYFLFLVIPLLACYSCMQTTDIEQEKQALISVNEEERDAYFARDLARLEAIWVQDSTSRRIFTSENDIRVLDGWMQIRSNYEKSINDDEMWENAVDVFATFSNNNVVLHGNSAILYHDIQWSGTYMGEPFDNKQKRVVCFVKEGDSWKINLTVQMNVPEEESAEETGEVEAEE